MKATVADQNESPMTPGGAELSGVKRNLLEKYLSRKAAVTAPAPKGISRRPLGELVPLSFAQEQVWIHAQMSGEIPFYNESITVHRKGSLDVAVLKRCLLEIIRRHEIWRTTFDILDEKPVQVVHSAPHELSLPVEDLRNLPQKEVEERVQLLATEQVRRPFDLKSGPLVRALLVRTGGEHYRLFVTFHQIVFDAVSAYRVFVPELIALYDAFSAGRQSPLAEPLIQYADFAYWQRQKRVPRSEDMAYWRGQLADELPMLDLPTGRVRPAMETHRGEMQRFSLPTNLIPALRTINGNQTVAAGLGLVHFGGQDWSTMTVA